MCPRSGGVYCIHISEGCKCIYTRVGCHSFWLPQFLATVSIAIRKGIVVATEIPDLLQVLSEGASLTGSEPKGSGFAKGKDFPCCISTKKRKTPLQPATERIEINDAQRVACLSCMNFILIVVVLQKMLNLFWPN